VCQSAPFGEWVSYSPICFLFWLGSYVSTLKTFLGGKLTGYVDLFWRFVEGPTAFVPTDLATLPRFCFKPPIFSLRHESVVEHKSPTKARFATTRKEIKLAAEWGRGSRII